MSNRNFAGGSFEAVPKVVTITPGGTIEANDEWVITVTDEAGGSVSFTAEDVGGTTVALVCTAIVAKHALQTDPRFTRLTFTDETTHVEVTQADGEPFYLSAATFENGGGAADAQTVTVATTITGRHSEDFNTKDNWIEGVVPVAGDNITFVSGNLRFGLAQAAVVTAEVIFAATWGAVSGTGMVGSEGVPFDIAPTVFVYNAAGTSKAFFDFNAAAIPLLVNSTGAPTSGFGFNISGGSALTTVTIGGGSVGFALGAGETFGAATIENNGGTVHVGNTTSGLTSFLQSSGTAVINCAGTNLRVTGGQVTTQGVGVAWTNISATKSGTVISNASGTVATAVADDGGTVDFMKSRVARTLTAGSVGFNGAIIAEAGVLTITNGIQPIGAIAVKGAAA